MSTTMLSKRAEERLAELNTPWRFIPVGDHDAVKNPGGLVTFSVAENVCRLRGWRDMMVTAADVRHQGAHEQGTRGIR